MTNSETARTPSLFKAVLLFVATAAMVVMSGRAPAQEPSSSPRAFASEPKVRVREALATGLNPIAFADRVVAHSDVRGNGSATLFFQVDADHEGQVSPTEPKAL